jgi:hypothetical protein
MLAAGNFCAVSGVFHECYGWRPGSELLLWPADSAAAQNGYRGVVAKKSRNRRGAGPARAGAAGQSAPAAAGTASARTASARTASARTASAGTTQLTAPPAAGQPEAYPGQRFGLPARGSGSVASMPRRVLALLIDWLLSMLIAYWLTGSQFWTIAVFAVEVYVLTATTGFTVGKRLVGIKTMRTNGGLVGFWWSLVRTAILLTVIPPLLTDRDLRGLHDRASDTIVVRL